jgi:Na+-driven multidrug efflux pump
MLGYVLFMCVSVFFNDNSFGWFYWEVNVFIAGTFGPSSLSIHAVAMSIMYLVFCPASGVMIALCTRVGNILPISASRAKAVLDYL